MIENWVDKNHHGKHARYLEDYIRVKDALYDAGKSDETIKSMLARSTKRRIKSSYDALFNNVIEGLARNRGSLSAAKIAHLKKRLEPYTSLEEINFNYMREIRKIEEEEY
jgi:hypothetical protein